jgi:hypothetical protein
VEPLRKVANDAFMLAGFLAILAIACVLWTHLASPPVEWPTSQEMAAIRSMSDIESLRGVASDLATYISMQGEARHKALDILPLFIFASAMAFAAFGIRVLRVLRAERGQPPAAQLHP